MHIIIILSLLALILWIEIDPMGKKRHLPYSISFKQEIEAGKLLDTPNCETFLGVLKQLLVGLPLRWRIPYLSPYELPSFVKQLIEFHFFYRAELTSMEVIERERLGVRSLFLNAFTQFKARTNTRKEAKHLKLVDIHSCSLNA